MKTSSLQKNKSAPLWAVFLISGTMLALFPVTGLAEDTSSDSGGFTPPVDSRAPYTPKVRALMNVLTLDEKISLVHGAVDPASLGQAGYLPGVPRLGIPVRRDADALGINVTANATALPSRIGLGSSFDRSAVYAAGQLEGNEGRALGVDLIYGPQVDLTRLPNWGRNNTTYGEDPFSTGQLAIEEVIGIQSKGLMSEVKHFAFYNGQAGVPAPGTTVPPVPALPTIVDDQTGHELYLKAYEYPVTEAEPSSIMASQQGAQIVPTEPSACWSTDNPLTETTILREQWGFPGFILSDYFATRSVHAILSGLDQEYPGYYEPALGFPIFFSTDLPALCNPSSSTYNPLYAIALDDAVAYVLYGYDRFGLLECASPSGPVSGCSLPPRPNINDIMDQDEATTEQLSEESAILLKNDGNSLPLKSSVLSSVAVIGPTARQVMVYGNGMERARGFPDRDAINPLQMLEALAPTGSSFTYAPGIDWIGTVVPASALAPGLTRTQSNSGKSKVDKTLDYESSDALAPGVTYTWTGDITVSTTDTYYLWMQQSFSNGASISIDGVAQSLFSPAVPVSTYPAGVIPTGGANNGAIISLTAGQHTIVVTAAIPSTATKPVTFRLTWSELGTTTNAAVAAARSAKVAVVFADDNGATDSDLVNSLAQNEDAMIEAVAAANPHTIVVLSTGNPVLTPWVDKVGTILEMWYPGQEGGTSTARLLLGLANPAGRLPISWPKSAEQTPFYNHPERVTGNGTDVLFSEGLYMGYRWYDEQKIDPQFCFGYGLSYTKFSYSNLSLSAGQNGVTVSFVVQNTGDVAGAEVPQVYVGPPAKPPQAVQFAVRKLVGFTRVTLNPGQSTTVTLTASALELSYWASEQQDWVLPSGERTFYVGPSSRSTQLSGRIAVVTQAN
jgi:beta-glucosidase